MNKIKHPLHCFNRYKIDARTVQPIIDKDGYMDAVAFCLNPVFKSVFILIKIGDLESMTNWKKPTVMTLVENIKGIDYLELGRLIHLDFELQHDEISDFIFQQNGSMLAGKIVPVTDNKQGDFYFEWN